MAVADRRNDLPMTETPVRTHEQSIIIEVTPEALYDLVSDITRTGEWGPGLYGVLVGRRGRGRPGRRLVHRP